MVDDSSRSLDEVIDGAVRGLFGRDSLYMLLWGVQLVAAACVTPLMTRALDTESFGTVVTANAVMQVVFVIAGLGLYTAIQRQYAGGSGVRDASRLLTVSIVGAIAVTALVDLTGPLWAGAVGFASYDGPVRIAVVWAGTSAVTNSALALLRSQDRLLAFGVVSMLQSVVAEVTSLLLVVGVRPTATMFLVGQLVVQVVAAVVSLCLAPPRMVRLRDRGVVAQALVFGVPLIPAVLSTFVVNSADRLIIQSMLGPAEAGRYQVAYNVGALPMLLLAVLNASWMPRIFSFNASEERTAVLAASRNLLYRLLMPVILGMAAGAPLVLRIWAPAEYRPNTLLLVNAIVLCSTVPYTAALAATRSLMAVGRTGYLAAAQILTAVANVLLNLLLIPAYGIEGSASATLVAFIVLHLLLLAWVRRKAPVPRPSLGLVLALTGCGALTVAIATVLPADSAQVPRLLTVLVTVGWFCAILRPVTGIFRRRAR